MDRLHALKAGLPVGFSQKETLYDCLALELCKVEGMFKLLSRERTVETDGLIDVGMALMDNCLNRIDKLVDEVESRIGRVNVLFDQFNRVVSVVLEPMEFDVILTAVGDKKIQVIKVLRDITGLELKKANAVVQGVPSPIKEGVSREEAEALKKILEGSGGTVEIKLARFPQAHQEEKQNQAE